jgi:hypothetical protein
VEKWPSKSFWLLWLKKRKVTSKIDEDLVVTFFRASKYHFTVRYGTPAKTSL